LNANVFTENNARERRDWGKQLNTISLGELLKMGICSPGTRKLIFSVTARYVAFGVKKQCHWRPQFDLHSADALGLFHNADGTSGQPGDVA